VYPLLAHEAGNRRDVHDGAAAGLFHDGDRVLHSEKNALGIDLHQPVPGRGAQGVRIEGPADAGIVDQDIELPELREGCGNGLLPGRLARHVQADEATHPAQAVSDLPPFRLEHIGHNHLRPFFGEDDGLAPAHAAGPTRDQRDFSSESHSVSLPVIRTGGGRA
jgi:hypothetical protein